jgi:hypothetical protein
MVARKSFGSDALRHVEQVRGKLHCVYNGAVTEWLDLPTLPPIHSAKKPFETPENRLISEDVAAGVYSDFLSGRIAFQEAVGSPEMKQKALPVVTADIQNPRAFVAGYRLRTPAIQNSKMPTAMGRYKQASRRDFYALEGKLEDVATKAQEPSF